MDLIGARSFPFLTRRNYFQEFKQLIPWSVLAGLVEGHFASIIVAKTFDGSERLIAIAAATPAAAFLFSLFWGMLCAGRAKIRLLTLISLGAVLLSGTLGAIPASDGGAVWFVAQMAAAQVLLSGAVTVRSAVWRSNYPHMARGRITARLQALRFVISITTVLFAAKLCDHDPSSYRFIFPAAALFGLIGISIMQRIHIRGERGELRRHATMASNDALDVRGPQTVTALLSPRRVLGGMVGVFHRDQRFAQYCVAQSFMGMANLMTVPVVVAVVTQQMSVGVSQGFWISTGLIQALPQLVRLGSLARWARLFDRVGVVRFRAYNVCFWVISLSFGAVATIVVLHSERFGGAALPLAVALFALRGATSGIGLGGGALAWNLGHLHFAKSDEAEVYMGIHVFLTGVRGVVAPLLGMWLFATIGWVVWMVALASSLTSLVLFVRMARQESNVPGNTS